MGLDTFYRGKKVLITGGTGTVGREIFDQILKQEPELVRVIDNSEEAIFYLHNDHVNKSNVDIIFGDVRDESKVVSACKGIDYIFHAAALKHVGVCEKAPFDAVQTNILGVENIIKAAIDNNVSHVVNTSTDKAVNPTNVMGASKLMGERLISAANNLARNENTKFCSTRFGNVLASKGSVLPIFHQQVVNGNSLTLTDKRMSRFVMSLQESVRLVLASGRITLGGEVFVSKMPVLNICDLAEVMIEIYGGGKEIEIKEVGCRPGEKLYEELITEEEITRSVELKDLIAILTPFDFACNFEKYHYPGETKKPVNKVYSSREESPMTKDEIASLISQEGIRRLIEGR